ncbi:hypothetical protein P3W85_44220 [Cupriavidus basilensis]|uniref:Uncharacterized protein n=1 Tax=Cupriavidus basilensis TaxID=68895 RepID=A0ABT6B4T5_9BURK|nr:hypothetical protein [Cupriavidus basilensis]MDF3839894.1 hypothetical protein [Cupriavidus basilensis]
MLIFSLKRSTPQLPTEQCEYGVAMLGAVALRRETATLHLVDASTRAKRPLAFASDDQIPSCRSHGLLDALASLSDLLQGQRVQR